MRDKMEFLRSLALFEAFNEDEIYQLAQITDAFQYQPGAVVAYQRDPAESLYIVREGQLDTYRVVDGVVVRDSPFTGVYKKGDYFHLGWLFAPDVHPAMVRVARNEPAIVYTIRYDEFGHFLEDHPDAVLDLPEAMWQEIDARPLGTVNEQRSHLNLIRNERIEFESRRTRLLLLLALIPGFVLTMALPAAAIVLGGLIADGQLATWLIVLAVLATLPGLGWMTFAYLDWANDYLVITNKFLVYRDFNLRTFRAQTQKIPLDQVQSVRVRKPNWLQTALGIGTVEVTTASQRGSLLFDKIKSPGHVERTLKTLRERRQSLDMGRTRTAVRKALARHFEVREEVKQIEDAPLADDGRQRSSRRRIRRRGSRTELASGQIIYGKHWLVLFLRVWWIFLLFGLTLGGYFLIIAFDPALRLPVTVLTILVLLIELGAFYYFYEDWANDVFTLDNTSVTDLDRGPFGLTVNRKTAELSNVQDVRAEQPNILAALFDYGDVTIDTAGVSAEIVFEDVARPTQVQAEILERRDRLMNVRRERDTANRLREVALALDEYQQLREQEKIKPRTPPIDATHDED